MRHMALVAMLLCATMGHAMPTILKMDGHLWAVKKVSQQKLNELLGDEENWTGDTECSIHTIFILKDQDVGDMAETLVHEIFHALTCGDDGEVHNEKYNNSSGSDHRGIYFAASRWLKVIHDNPALVRWLQDAENTPND